MKKFEFKKQEISKAFDVTVEEAPKFDGWDCIKVENSHTNGLSTYYTYLHESKTLKVIVRQSDHFARHESDQKGFLVDEMIFPSVIKTTSFSIFKELEWVNKKEKSYLIERFCK